MLLLFHVVGSIESHQATGHRKQLAVIHRVAIQPRDVAAAWDALELEATQ